MARSTVPTEMPNDRSGLTGSFCIIVSTRPTDSLHCHRLFTLHFENRHCLKDEVRRHCGQQKTCPCERNRGEVTT